MKTNLLKYLCAVALFTFVSCSGNETKNQSDITGHDEKILPNGEGLTVESFDIVPLEQTDKSIINAIARVEVVDTMIIVQSQDKVLAFSRSGKLIRQYGDRGNGHGEYLGVQSFVIDKRNENIKIIDQGANKILTFDLNGNLLSDKKFDEGFLSGYTYSGSYMDDENILFTNEIYNDKNILYWIMNIDNGQKNTVYQFPVKTENVGVYIGRHPVSFFEGEFKMIMPFNNKIYQLKDGKMIPVMTVLTKKSILKERQIEVINDYSINTYVDLMNEGSFTGFTGIFETEKYILLDESFSLNYFLIDKKSGSGQLYTYSMGDKFPLINIIGTDGNDFIGVGDPFARTMRMKDEFPETITDKNMLKLKNFIDSDSVSSDANPCLFFYKLK